MHPSLETWVDPRPIVLRSTFIDAECDRQMPRQNVINRRLHDNETVSFGLRNVATGQVHVLFSNVNFNGKSVNACPVTPEMLGLDFENVDKDETLFIMSAMPSEYPVIELRFLHQVDGLRFGTLDEMDNLIALRR